MQKISEKQEQIALFKRAAYHPVTRDYMWASASGGSRNFMEAVNLKRQGMLKKGVPDIFLAYPSNVYHGLFIELKRREPRGVLSSEQRAMLALLEKVGYAVHVAYGWEEAWAQIERYLLGAPRVIACPDCKTTEIAKNGMNAKQKQQYVCLNELCGRSSFISTYAREHGNL